MNRVAKTTANLPFGAKVKVVTKAILEKMRRDRSFDYATKFSGQHQFNGQTLNCTIYRQWFPIADASFKDGRKNVKGILVAQAFKYDAGASKDYMQNLVLVTTTKTEVDKVKEVTLEFSGQGAILNPVSIERYNAIVNSKQTFDKAYVREVEFEGKTAVESTQRINVGTCALGTIAREASIVKEGDSTLKYFYNTRIYFVEAGE